ncbi:hypothetical protein C0J29_27680 [Mycobacterium paragordonae]|nr:hypothetical protein C0J29_27680 [Mycobacterium paragordonae]
MAKISDVKPLGSAKTMRSGLRFSSAALCAPAPVCVLPRYLDELSNNTNFAVKQKQPHLIEDSRRGA